MDADEKLLALKKAYADIILNISKEAAMRVMSSEKRAARYQYELKVGKEEALRMLMLAKQMMDSKNSQGENASLNQQKKIEELEAQLHEAEDIVKDLREELGEAQTELERLKKEKFQHSNVPINACSRKTDSEILSYHSSKFFLANSEEDKFASDVTMPNPSQKNECCSCNSEAVCMCSLYIRNRDLPSIMSRGKNPGLYRSGWSQRIRACERKIIDKETDKVKDENKQEQGEDASKTPAFRGKTLCELEGKLLADTKFNNFQSFPMKRRRATRVRKNCKTDEGLKEKMVSFGNETGVMESFSSSDCKTDENVDVPSNGLESNSSFSAKGLNAQSVGERVIKYTFQRKRKREALDGSKVNATIETEMEIGDEQNGELNLEESKTEESSRDNRRLAQIARQLMSLSEKKW